MLTYFSTVVSLYLRSLSLFHCDCIFTLCDCALFLNIPLHYVTTPYLINFAWILFLNLDWSWLIWLSIILNFCDGCFLLIFVWLCKHGLRMFSSNLGALNACWYIVYINMLHLYTINLSLDFLIIPLLPEISTPCPFSRTFIFLLCSEK